MASSSRKRLPQIDLHVADDQSEPAGNLAAAQQLVEGHHVGGIVSGSAFTSGGGSYLKKVGLPVVGDGFSIEYQQIPNFISNLNVAAGPTTTTETSRLWGSS